MTDREQEAIERISDQGDVERVWAKQILDALLASSPCPTCGGTGKRPVLPLDKFRVVSGGEMPLLDCPDCTDGTVPPLLVWNPDV